MDNKILEVKTSYFNKLSSLEQAVFIKRTHVNKSIKDLVDKTHHADKNTLEYKTTLKTLKSNRRDLDVLVGRVEGVIKLIGVDLFTVGKMYIMLEHDFKSLTF